MNDNFRKIGQFAAVTGGAGLILTLLAPYGTHSFSLPARALYWIGLCFAGGGGAAIAEYLALSHFGWTKIWKRVGLQSIFATLAVLIFLLGKPIIDGIPVGFSGAAVLSFYVWLIAILIAGVGGLLSAQKQAPDHGAEQKRPAIIERLPANLRSAEIYALAAEDHYVRIITSRGDALILMRLSDAIREAAPLPGLAPHRSWWVAEAGVKSVKGKQITLQSDQIVPISRSGAKTVKEAGW